MLVFFSPQVSEPQAVLCLFSLHPICFNEEGTRLLRWTNEDKAIKQKTAPENNVDFLKAIEQSRTFWLKLHQATVNFNMAFLTSGLGRQNVRIQAK